MIVTYKDFNGNGIYNIPAGSIYKTNDSLIEKVINWGINGHCVSYKNPFVSISIDNAKLERTISSLSFNIDDILYSNEEAQSQIDKYFNIDTPIRSDYKLYMQTKAKFTSALSLFDDVSLLENNRALLNEYKESYDNIVYNRNVNNILTCPSCTNKLYINEDRIIDASVKHPLKSVKHNVTYEQIVELENTIQKQLYDKSKIDFIQTQISILDETYKKYLDLNLKSIQYELLTLGKALFGSDVNLMINEHGIIYLVRNTEYIFNCIEIDLITLIISKPKFILSSRLPKYYNISTLQKLQIPIIIYLYI